MTGKLNKLQILSFVGCVVIALAAFLCGCDPQKRFAGVYVDETKSNMRIIMAAIKEYRRTVGNYPSESDWVGELAGNPASRKLIGKLGENVWSTQNKKEFRDAWDNRIEYSRSGGRDGTPELISGGPDGDMTTEEDNVRVNE